MNEKPLTSTNAASPAGMPSPLTGSSPVTHPTSDLRERPDSRNRVSVTSSNGAAVAPRVTGALGRIAARVTVYRPGVGLVDVAGDWRDRMNTRHAVLVPARA